MTAPLGHEPLVTELGAPGRRGVVPPPPIDGNGVADLLPLGIHRTTPLVLPEMSEPEVLRHYLRLSQQALINAGGQRIAAADRLAEVHPHQDDTTLQGLLAIAYQVDLILRELSGMDRFTFQQDAAETHAYVTTAYFQARGEPASRREVITTARSHQRNEAAARAAGFHVITVENDVTALSAAVSDRTASLMINNPDRTGTYDPHITRWIDIVHEAGALCFYDQTKETLGRVRAADLGFDACADPTTGAYGCTTALEPFLPGPLIDYTESGYRTRENSTGREFPSNLPQVYSWLLAMGTASILEAAEISVLTKKYLKARLTAQHLAEYTEETGITPADLRHRMADFGIAASWLDNDPWTTPETYPIEEIDHWLEVLAHVMAEGRSDPALVRSAPHTHPTARVDETGLDDPNRWTTTWRAYRRK